MRGREREPGRSKWKMALFKNPRPHFQPSCLEIDISFPLRVQKYYYRPQQKPDCDEDEAGNSGSDME